MGPQRCITVHVGGSHACLARLFIKDFPDFQRRVNKLNAASQRICGIYQLEIVILRAQHLAVRGAACRRAGVPVDAAVLTRHWRGSPAQDSGGNTGLGRPTRCAYSARIAANIERYTMVVGIPRHCTQSQGLCMHQQFTGHLHEN
jgi:hypothetical protein